MDKLGLTEGLIDTDGLTLAEIDGDSDGDTLPPVVTFQ